MQANVDREMGSVQGHLYGASCHDSRCNPQRILQSKVHLVHLLVRLKRKKWILGQSMLVTLSMFSMNGFISYTPSSKSTLRMIPSLLLRMHNQLAKMFLRMNSKWCYPSLRKSKLEEIEGKQLLMTFIIPDPGLPLQKVDYACTAEEIRLHFQACGIVNQVTIRTDKFGHPKGFAYVEFADTDAVHNALLLNESELRGRKLKVSAKRTNIPGMKQYHGRRPFGFKSRWPFMPSPSYRPYGHGRVPRFRRPMRYMPY